MRARVLFIALTASLLTANAFAATTNQSPKHHPKTAQSGHQASKKKHHQNGQTAHKKGKAHNGQRHV